MVGLYYSASILVRGTPLYISDVTRHLTPLDYSKAIGGIMREDSANFCGRSWFLTFDRPLLKRPQSWPDPMRFRRPRYHRLYHQQWLCANCGPRPAQPFGEI